jgi:hypothetical protein
MPRRSLSRRFDRECKPVRRLRRLTRGDAPPGELESGPFCGLQAIRLRRVVRTLGATPGSHPSQPETQGNPRFMADLVRTSVRRVRRVGSHLAELKEFCGPGRRGGLVGHTVRAWPDATCCDGSVNGRKMRP